MRQCENGHFYDEMRYASCPYCQGSGGGFQGQQFNAAPQYNAAPPYGGDPQFGGAPQFGGSGDIGKTMAAMPESGDIGKTMAVMPESSSADAGKTVALGFDRKEFHAGEGGPAVGFVICTRGPQKGSDFKLSFGRNNIGRSIASNIALVDDESVSRESHAVLTYDAKHNDFLISPGTGNGLTYLNEELVESSKKLKAYDIIEVGKTQLIFLPLCGEKFRWDDETAGSAQ